MGKFHIASHFYKRNTKVAIGRVHGFSLPEVIMHMTPDFFKK